METDSVKNSTRCYVKKIQETRTITLLSYFDKSGPEMPKRIGQLEAPVDGDGDTPPIIKYQGKIWTNQGDGLLGLDHYLETTVTEFRADGIMK